MDQYQDILSTLKYYKLVLVGNAVISSIIYPFVVYLILHHTPKETCKAIKCNIFNVATTCYVLVIVLAIWQPVPLTPLLAAFSAGPFRFSDSRVMMLMYDVTLILIFNLSLAYAMSFLYHYAAMKPSSRIMEYVNSQSTFYTAYCIFALLIDGILVAFIHTTHNPEELKTLVDDDHKSFLATVYVNEPTLAAFSSANLRSKLALLYTALIILFVACKVVVIITLNIKTVKAIKATEHIVRPGTYRIQLMIYRIFLFKTLSFAFFFVFPFICIVLVMTGILTSHITAMAMYALVSLHTPVLYLQLIFVIRPYRRQTKRLLLRMIYSCSGNPNRYAEPELSSVSKQSFTPKVNTFSNISKIHPVD